MKFTVVTCVKDGEQFLGHCLQTIQEQKYKDIEHVIVEGFSKDGTMAIIGNYIKQNPNKNIKLIRSEPKGISNAMNIGIRNSTGEIIHFLHSDDYYISSDAVERAVKLFQTSPGHEWVIGNIVVEINGEIREFKKNITKKNLQKMMSVFNWIPHENTFVKKAIFDEYGYFDEKLKQTMDYEFWLRFIDKTDPLLVNESFTVFIIHPHSTSTNPANWTRIAREMLHTWKNYKIIPFVGKAEKLTKLPIVDKISSLVRV